MLVSLVVRSGSSGWHSRPATANDAPWNGRPTTSVGEGQLCAARGCDCGSTRGRLCGGEGQLCAREGGFAVDAPVGHTGTRGSGRLRLCVIRVIRVIRVGVPRLGGRARACGQSLPVCGQLTVTRPPAAWVCRWSPFCRPRTAGRWTGTASTSGPASTPASSGGPVAAPCDPCSAHPGLTMDTNTAARSRWAPVAWAMGSSVALRSAAHAVRVGQLQPTLPPGRRRSRHAGPSAGTGSADRHSGRVWRARRAGSRRPADAPAAAAERAVGGRRVCAGDAAERTDRLRQDSAGGHLGPPGGGLHGGRVDQPGPR